MVAIFVGTWPKNYRACVSGYLWKISKQRVVTNLLPSGLEALLVEGVFSCAAMSNGRPSGLFSESPVRTLMSTVCDGRGHLVRHSNLEVSVTEGISVARHN